MLSATPNDIRPGTYGQFASGLGNPRLGNGSQCTGERQRLDRTPLHRQPPGGLRPDPISKKKKEKSDEKTSFFQIKTVEQIIIIFLVMLAQEAFLSANQAANSGASIIIFFTVNPARLRGR
jgi:hypothetical protein